MRPEDIEKLVSVGRPTVHPSGVRAVAAVSHPDLGADADVGQLWEFPLDGAAPRRITRGRSDSSPRFSPDGRLLAFLRAAGGPPQLHVMDARGGEPVALTDRVLGVSAFTWSPDSTRLAFVARDPEQGRYGTVEGLGGGAEAPRRITTTTYTANGLGWTLDRRAQLFVVDLRDPGDEPDYEQAPRADGSTPERHAVPEARRLTSFDADVSSPSFTPDGTAVVVLAALHEERDEDLRNDAWRIPLDGGEPVRLTPGDEARSYDWAGHGPDGRLWLAGIGVGESGRDFVAKNVTIFLGGESGLVALTDPAVFDAGGEPAFADERTLLVPRLERGSQLLAAVRDDGTVADLTRPGSVVTAVATGGGRTVVALRRQDTFGELGVVESDGVRELTRFGDAARGAGLVLPVEEEHPSRDGYPVHGWVAVPGGPGPHPVLLMIHGGPFAQYDVALFDETQVWVEAGYAVAYCNPRGSAGYGADHGRAIRQRMGTLDLDDVLAFLDGVIAAHPEIDGARAGILGGSYGGYLTAWTIAHDHRFAAAVVERGFLDPEAFIGTSDIGAFFSDEYTGEAPELRLAQSPQAVVGQVTTPVLVLHSEDDLRCPLPQATRYYQALRRQGTEAELLVFPGEDHELSRSGRPRHRVQRFEAILEWFARHLPTEGV